MKVLTLKAKSNPEIRKSEVIIKLDLNKKDFLSGARPTKVGLVTPS